MVMGHAAMCDTPHASSRLGSLAVQFLLDIVPRLVPAASKQNVGLSASRGTPAFSCTYLIVLRGSTPRSPGSG